MNLYGFVGNDLVNRIDVLGLFWPGYPLPPPGGQPNPPDFKLPPVDPSDGISYPEGAQHWFQRGGDLHIPFSSIDPGWGMSDFIENACGYQDGTHQIKPIPKQTNLFPNGFFTNAGPGVVTLTLTGSITISSTSISNVKKFSFVGTLAPEAKNPFDFDDKTPDRPFPFEEITTTIRELHNLTGLGEDFDVYIDGDRKIKASGCCLSGMMK